MTTSEVTITCLLNRHSLLSLLYCWLITDLVWLRGGGGGECECECILTMKSVHSNYWHTVNYVRTYSP